MTADSGMVVNGSVTCMTLDEVRKSKKEMLSPNDIAPILGVHPYSINKAKKDGTLEFKATFIGRNLKIPRIAFLKYMEEYEPCGD